MKVNKSLATILATSLTFTFTGCSNLPGTAGQQGAVVGGASGAAVGAAVSKNRALGAVIGGAVGAAGGYVVGQNKDKILGSDNRGAEEASRKAQTAPVTPDQARAANTADINHDGYVTMDEVVALKAAGFSDNEIIARLQATGQVFNLTEDQKRYLLTQGLSQGVVDSMMVMNQTAVAQPPAPAETYPNQDVIGRPR
jgi:osmotically inducible lipoprotein OsmB